MYSSHKCVICKVPPFKDPRPLPFYCQMINICNHLLKVDEAHTICGCMLEIIRPQQALSIDDTRSEWGYQVELWMWEMIFYVIFFTLDNIAG